MGFLADAIVGTYYGTYTVTHLLFDAASLVLLCAVAHALERVCRRVLVFTTMGLLIYSVSGTLRPNRLVARTTSCPMMRKWGKAFRRLDVGGYRLTVHRSVDRVIAQSLQMTPLSAPVTSANALR
jgi:hypothetical protein